MNEQSAREQGLNFTGIYSSNKQEVKDRIAEIKTKYPLARVRLVNVPHSRLSRSGPGMGYSAYADKVYSAYKTWEDSKKLIDTHQERLTVISLEYARKVEDENMSFATQKEKHAAASQIITEATAKRFSGQRTRNIIENR
jgi:hypothetical protein